MALQQAHYTVCPEGVIPGTHGYAFSSASGNWDAAHLREIEGLSGYKLTRDLERRLGQALAAAGNIDTLVAEAPHTLQYRRTVNGLFVVTRVVYLGMADKRRLGNLFAHSIYTAEGSDLAGLSPADLWTADFWQASQDPEKELPVLELKDHSAGFPLEELLSFAAEPGRREHACGLLSAILASLLEDPRQRQVLIVDEPANVARWIALASRILPASLVSQLTFTTYTGDPSGASDCVVVGTRAEAPGLRLESPAVRFGYWTYSFETGLFPDDPPLEPYVERIIESTDLKSLAVPTEFLPWANQVLAQQPELTGHLDEILCLRYWLDEPTLSGSVFHDALEIARELLCPSRSPVLAEVWRALEGSLTTECIVAATRLATHQTVAQENDADAASTAWWSVIGAQLEILEADQLQDATQALRDAGLTLDFLDKSVVGPRAQSAVQAALGRAESEWRDPLALLTFFAENGLLLEPGTPEIRRFLSDLLTHPDLAALLPEVTLRFEDTALPAILAETWAEIISSTLAGKDEPARIVVEMLNSTETFRRRLETQARNRLLFPLFLAARNAAGEVGLAARLKEVVVAASDMKIQEEETVAALDEVFERHRPTDELTCEQARSIQSAVNRKWLGRCTFGALVDQKAKEKPRPDPVLRAGRKSRPGPVYVPRPRRQRSVIDMIFDDVERFCNRLFGRRRKEKPTRPDSHDRSDSGPKKNSQSKSDDGRGQ